MEEAENIGFPKKGQDASGFPQDSLRIPSGFPQDSGLAIQTISNFDLFLHSLCHLLTTFRVTFHLNC